MFARAYWLFACLGLMTFSASFIMGFRYDPNAPARNLVIDVAMYAAYIAVHIGMTLPSFKKAVYGRPEGTPAERQIYVTVAILTWLVLYGLHLPVGGVGFAPPAWLQYFGLCAVLLSFVGFFEFATFANLGQLLGVPGAELSHTAGSETPLMTEGPYAAVRHPMYRAAFFLTAASLVIHPNASQLLFAVLTAGSFVGFIPLEERQLLRSRGEAYRDYMRATPYRVFRGIW